MNEQKSHLVVNTAVPASGSDIGATVLEPSGQIRPGLAHKRKSESLWLTSIDGDSEDAFEVSFRLPPSRSGLRFASVVEAQRQAGIVYAHRWLSIPEGWAFVLTSISLDLSVTSGPHELEAVEGTIDVRRVSVTQARQRIKSVLLDFTVRGDRELKGHGLANGIFVPPAVYDRIRQARPIPDSRHGDSALVEGDLTGAQLAPIVIDHTDPVISDHVGDHFAAMAIVCAIEALALSERPGHRLDSLSITFAKYAELEPPPQLVVFNREFNAFEGFVRQTGFVNAQFVGQTRPRGL